MKRFLLVFLVSVMVLSCFFGKTLVVANAKESSVSGIRYYKDIEIQPGDSLWTIAKTYNQNSGMDIREYICELKQINSLHTDRIQAGDSLTIVYFASAEAGE